MTRESETECERERETERDAIILNFDKIVSVLGVCVTLNRGGQTDREVSSWDRSCVVSIHFDLTFQRNSMH